MNRHGARPKTQETQRCRGFWASSTRRLCLLLFVACLLGVGVFATLYAQTGTKEGGGKPKGVGDIPLVEKVLSGRREYQYSLEKIRKYYIGIGDIERARWAEDELKQFHRILKHAYRLDLDVPPPTLQATQNIPAANKIYQRAMTYKDRGWGTDYIDNQRRAELLFQQILSQYPSCDKIGDTAYQLGDIYEGRAYKQYRRAAQYYERCFQWKGNSQNHARLKAARIYDKHLLERGRAIELYKAVTNHETDSKRIAEAEKRLNELSGSR